MRAIHKILIFTFLLSVTFGLKGQTRQSLSYGIDPVRDSIAFAQFRLHMDSIRAERPTIALVLSGGGAKGAAHISIIRYLEQQGIPIDLVMGTSIGGLVGGLYACGYTGEELEAIIRNQDWDYLLFDSHPRRFDAMQQKEYDRQFQLSIPYGTYKWDFLKPEINRRSLLRDGIVQGRNIEDLLSSLTVGYGDEIDFLKLPIPFVCVASDMISAKPKVWHSGSLVTAMRSTMSIPGLFTPVRTNGMVLMDGSMRSNFPADIARNLGADIIIGVDISAPALSAGQMQNMVDVVFQTSDILGRESFEAAKKATDIYIQPELSDFSLLSFDNASIATIIDRGRQAVMKHTDEIDEIKRQLEGKNVVLLRHSRFKKAVNLHSQTIKIKDIQFDGINAKEEKYLRRRLNILFLQANDLRIPLLNQHDQNSDNTMQVHILELENAIAEMMGTKAFEKVTYEILGDSEPYTLKFNCFRAPLNLLGGSVRFDAIEFASILTHIGINANKLTGPRLDLKARLGLNTIVGGDIIMRSGRGFDIGTELSYQAARNGVFHSGDDEFRIEFNRARGDVYFSLAPWRKMNIKLGLRADYFYQTSLLSNNIRQPNSTGIYEKSNIYLGPYLKMRFDSFDEPYFPTHGSNFRIDYNWYQKALLHEHDDFHAIRIGYRQAVNFGRLTFIPFLDARYVSQQVTPYINMLSVSDANCMLDQQVTFAGLNTPYSTMPTLGTAGLKMQLRLGKNHYLTATAQLLHEVENVAKIFSGSDNATYFGSSLEYAYKSIIGPIRFNVHWSDLEKALGFYIGFGFDF